MNARSATLISLAVNAALVLLILSLARRPAGSSAPPAELGPAPVPTTRVETNSAEAAPEPLPESATFDWSQVASTNFFAYRDALRAVGCPDATVRDILTSEINTHFMLCRRPLIEQIQSRLWPVMAEDPRQLEALIEGNLEKIDEEREATLEAVLARRPGWEEENLPAMRDGWQSQYEWLPADLSAELVALEESRTRERWRLEQEYATRTDPESQKQLQSRLQELGRDWYHDRDAALGPELAAEFKLRQSDAANWAGLPGGFETSEAEWRTVATAINRVDESIQQLHSEMREEKLDQSEFEARRNALVEERKEVTRTALGPERYAEYERSQDGDLQHLNRITRRLGLDNEVAIEARELQRTAQAHLEQVRQNPDLSADQRTLMEQALLEETRRTFRQRLGDPLLNTYLENGGDWLTPRETEPAPGE